MAEVDIDPFSDHDKTDAQPDEMGETTPLTPGGGSTWEPERKQETSFGGTSPSTEVLENCVKALYQLLHNKCTKDQNHVQACSKSAKMKDYDIEESP